VAEFGTAERLELEAIARRFEGQLGMCAVRLDDEAALLDVLGGEIFPAASILTIAIALELYCRVEEGSLALAERVTLSQSDKVVGPGVLAQLGEGLMPTLQDLVHLAITISDNTAANLLLDRVGLSAVNDRLERLGLVHTRVTGRMLVEETQKGPPAVEDFGLHASVPSGRDDGRGERSPAAARELVKLLSAIHRREGLPDGACSAVLDILLKTQTASSIRRGLPEARFRDRTPAKLHYKTGSIRGVVNDVGIVATERGAYAIALLSKGSRDLRPTQDNVARVALADASRVIYKAMRGE
jgi:beta-lactamase class A